MYRYCFTYTAHNRATVNAINRHNIRAINHNPVNNDLAPPTQLPLPSKVMGVSVTPSVEDTSPTLTVKWQALAEGAVTYTLRYSTEQGEVNTPPEGALEVMGISGTSTILTALERGTTYYIWVVGVAEGREGPHSDRMSGVTYDSELRSTMRKGSSLIPA